jgi:hypothetical protein
VKKISPLANVLEEIHMRHLIACFKAGSAGQPMPARADKSTGKIVAISSAVGGGAGLIGFGLGALVFRGRKTEEAAAATGGKK